MVLRYISCTFATANVSKKSTNSAIVIAIKVLLAAYATMIKINHSYILSLLAVALCVVCVMSVYTPIHFSEQQEQREQAVKHRLMKIRNAEERYRGRHGEYAADFKTLVGSGLLADSLQYIPYTEKQRFDLAATTIIGKSGRQVPLMECGAKYGDYLVGLDQNSIANLIEEANNAGRYPGLRIGDIATPNDNAGSWE